MPPQPSAASANRRIAAVLRSCSRAGITDPDTVRAFRLDAVDAALVRSLPLGPRRRPRSLGGLLIPTFNPSEPDKVIGLVRVQDAQHRHGFLGPPAGIAGAVDIASAKKVVLADAPLLALRLHQAGVQHVALVEEPAVLRPLANWLMQRTVALASYRKRGLAAMRAALPPTRQADATGALLQSFEGGSPAAALVALGFQRLQLRRRQPISPITSETMERVSVAARQVLFDSGRRRGRRRFRWIEMFDQEASVFAHQFGAGITSDLTRGFIAPDQRLLRQRRADGMMTLPCRDRAQRVVGLTLIPTGWPRVVTQIGGGDAGIIATDSCWQQPEIVDVLPPACLEWMSLLYGTTWLLPAGGQIRQVARVAAEIGIRRVRLHGSHPDRVVRAIRAAGIRTESGAQEPSDLKRKPDPDIYSSNVIVNE
jgi:hypothetical protein